MKNFFYKIASILIFLSCSFIVYAADPGHVASSISPGSFESGNYTFPDSLNVTLFFEASSMFFINPITQMVGIGTDNPNSMLDVRGNTQISGSLNVTGDVFLPTSSLLSCSGKLITDTDGNVTCATDESYNSTYDLYAYNQTTPAIDYVNNQGYLTSSGANLTYLFVGENETSGSYNSTYDTWAYNQTAPAMDYADTLVGSTYNATYDLWSYNQTTPAMTYADTLVGADDWTNVAFLNDTVFNTTYGTVWTNVLFVNESTLNDTYVRLDDINNSYSGGTTDWTNVAFLNDTVFNSTYGTVWTNVLFMNETLLNDTFVRLDDINNSYALNSSLSVYDTWTYNQTTPAMTYADTLVGSTYNETYDTWAYNQTTPAMSYADSISGSNTYNSTYDTYAYNQTQPFTDWLSTFAYDYNQTIPAMDYADTLVGSTYNATYDLWSYNQTTPAMAYADSLVGSTYNATYDTWAYNQTTPATDWVTAQGYLTTTSWLNVVFNNESLMNDTFVRLDDINNSYALNSSLSVYDAWAYNQSQPVLDYIVAQGYLASADANSTFVRLDDVNSSYALNSSLSVYDSWAYNMTAPAMDYADTLVGSTYNSTYDTWAYNQTTPAIAYSDAQGYLTSSGANLTYLFVGENLSIDDWTNVAWLNDTVFNTTYGTVWTNVLFINESTLNDSYALNSSLSIYDTWAYNQTIPAMDYADTLVGSTYNATYDLYAYNQTLVDSVDSNLTLSGTTLGINGVNIKAWLDNIYAAAGSYLSSLDANSTYVRLDDVNNSYANIQWDYNQTTPAISYVNAQGFLTGIDWTNVAWLNDSVFNNSYITTVDWTNVVFGNDTLLNSTYVRLDDINNSYSGGTVRWDNVAFLNETTLNGTYVRLDDINNSYALNSSLSVYDTYGVYNQTIPAMDYADTLVGSTYNATYDLYAYNMTTPAISWVTAQNYLTTSTTDWTNVLFVNESTLNETYVRLDDINNSYSGGIVGWDNVVFSNESLLNDTYARLDNINDTYALNSSLSVYDAWAYNQSQPVLDYIVAQGYLASADANSTFVRLDDVNNSYALNSSLSVYDTWAYNMTTPAIDYVTLQGFLTSIDWTNISYTNQSNTFLSAQIIDSSLNVTSDLFLSTYGLLNCQGKLITDADGNVTCGVDAGGGMDYTNIAMINETTLNDTYLLKGENLTVDDWTNVAWINQSNTFTLDQYVSGSLNLDINLTVNSSLLIVDSINNWVGINTTTRTQALDVQGNVNITGNSSYLYFGSGGYMYDNGTALILGHE